jgi:hypothetical protein
MLRITVIAAAASFALLGGAASQAAPLDQPPFHGGDSVPIEPGVLDPVNDCLRFPELCGPPDVPPDPCQVDPSLCDPEPPDPCVGRLCPVDVCDVFPSLCEDPPIADPGSEPPEPPEQEVFDHALAGSAKVKANGRKTSEPYALLLNVDTAAQTFSAMDGSGTVYSGNLAPKGTKGVKFSLFLDEASSDGFEADVAGRGVAASGLPGGTLAGGSSKLTLRLNEDGTVSLKIKSEVLVTGVGTVVFKANLVSEAP